MIEAAAPEHTIHVAFACDANYVMPLAVAMCSAAANCRRDRRLVFHVFQTGIGEADRGKIERSLKHTGFPELRVNWFEAPVDRLAGAKIVNKWLSSAALVRLLIPELLPPAVETVLYLDCDVVVDEDLAELWDTDLADKSLGAVRDTIGWVSNPDGGVSNYRELGIPADTPYFNSGVLLINVSKWRKNQTSERLLEYLWHHQAIIRYEDQEVLNAVLYDDWIELDFRWNWQIIWRGVRLGTHKMAWVPERARKSIVHFITAEKPWLPGCDYDEKEYFFKYVDRTEWSGWRVPWRREIWFRSLRPLTDARNAAGRLRRRLEARLVPAKQ